MLAAVALLVVAGALAWSFVLVPLERDLAATESALREARAGLDVARRQAAALREVATTPAAQPGADAKTATERILVEHGVRSAVTTLQAKDGRVELTFESIDFAAVTRLVEALGRDARLFPVDALLAARTSPGSVRAELALVRDTAP
jgi:type II secretory pathway component PulM